MINQTIFEARIGKIEQKTTQKGAPYWNISLAIPAPRHQHRQTNQWEDQPNTTTTWIKTTLWEPNPATNTGKGAKVLATGRLITRTWQNQQGETQTSLELKNPTIALIEPAGQNNHQPPAQNNPQWAPQKNQQNWDDTPPF